MILEAIKPTIAEGLHTFVAVFDVAGQTIEVPVPGPLLLDYEQFQRHILAQTGLLFTLPMAEGRDPYSANHFFKREMGFLLQLAAERATAATDLN